MILETKRLFLRRLEENDALRMSEYRNKKEVARYQSWKKYSYKEAKKRIDYCKYIQELHRPKTNYHLAIILKENNRMIGDIFVDVMNKTTFGLGYTLDSDYWNLGYASEMVDSFITYMHETYSFEKVICYAYKQNKRSIHLLEKLGFYQFDESFFYSDVGYMKKLR